VPEVAFVQVMKGSFDPKVLKQNGTHMKPGVVAFGSRHLPGDVMNDLFGYPKRHPLQLLRPADLLRIALFDLWVENIDRGRPVEGGHNYNLLMVPQDEGHILVPFDHAFILGGETLIRIFHPGNPRPSVEKKLFRTRMFQEVMSHLGAERRTEVVNHFFGSLLPATDPDALFRILDEARPHWPYPPNFEARLRNFLWDPARLALVEQQARSYLHQLS
jgi:hypothetical protein